MWIDHAAEPTYQQTMKTKMTQKPNQNPAIVQMPFNEYTDAPGVNASSLKLFLDLPLKYKQEQLSTRLRPQSKALEMGKIVHSFVLENRIDWLTAPATYTNEKGEVKSWNWNANYCKEWAKQNRDYTLLTQQEESQVLAMRDATQADRWSNKIINGCDAFEGSVFAGIGGTPCKIRMDGISLSGRYIMDLKTCADASDRAIIRDCTSFNYYLQAAFYIDVAQAAGLPVDDFYFVFLEKSQPPLISVKKVSEQALTYGRELYRDAMERLELCQKTSLWPGYTDMASEDGQMPELHPPAWVQSKALDELVIAGEAFMAD